MQLHNFDIGLLKMPLFWGFGVCKKFENDFWILSKSEICELLQRHFSTKYPKKPKKSSQIVFNKCDLQNEAKAIGSKYVVYVFTESVASTPKIA